MGMRRSQFLISGCVVVISLSGCGGGPAPSTQAGASSTASEMYTYEVRSDQGGIASTGISDNVSASAGKNALQIKSSRITANGVNYGLAKNGDKVLLDADGSVYVNEKKREKE